MKANSSAAPLRFPFRWRKKMALFSVAIPPL
jgi:hypothetical protein